MDPRGMLRTPCESAWNVWTPCESAWIRAESAQSAQIHAEYLGQCKVLPNVYKIQGHNSAAMTWSATALGGAVATIIMIIATLFEFSYIPTTWNNTSHLMRRLIFLLVTLAITCGPTFYIAIVESHGTGGSLSLILGIVQFFISAIATLLFSIRTTNSGSLGVYHEPVMGVPALSALE
jgi:hypothetical protein